MTDAENHRLGDYVETSAGGEHVRAYMPAQLPPKPPLELGRFMRVSERAIAAPVASTTYQNVRWTADQAAIQGFGEYLRWLAPRTQRGARRRAKGQGEVPRSVPQLNEHDPQRRQRRKQRCQRLQFVDGPGVKLGCHCPIVDSDARSSCEPREIEDSIQVGQVEHDLAELNWRASS